MVLDTSAYSHLRAGHPEVIRLLSSAERVYLPVVVLGELEAAFLRGRRVKENRQILEEFLAENFVSALLVTPDVARLYGRIFAALRRAGTPIPINDVWIAAIAVDSGAHLLTLDSDFERIAGLDCTVLRV